MTRFTTRVCVAILLCGSLAATAPARAAGRPADVILKQIDAVRVPVFEPNKENDKAYTEQYDKEESAAERRRAPLIGELYRIDPDNPRLVELLPERWRALCVVGGDPDDATDLTGELTAVLARARSDELRREAAFWKANSALCRAADDTLKIKAVDEFIALAPKDEPSASHLVSLWSYYVLSRDKENKDLLQRLVEHYPSTHNGEKARGVLRRLDAVGKPFALEFIDAISGVPVSTQRLKGKVVVVDFWATWCGSCVAEMPALKTLYAEYKDKGVAFIGVSLDMQEGGLDGLKAFVKKKGITWPQYYQGGTWDSKFSMSWGINSIPTAFLVDQEGKVYSVEACGKLETMIPELLNRPVSDRPDPSTIP